jgi:hypothetical protein
VCVRSDGDESLESGQSGMRPPDEILLIGQTLGVGEWGASFESDSAPPSNHVARFFLNAITLAKIRQEK